MGRLVPRRKTLLRCFWCPILALLLSLVLFGLPAATAGAQGTPAVVATSQGITVGFSNLTPHVLNRVGLFENVANAGPGYPVAILPYQHTGTSVTMRGGVASGADSAVAYAIGNTTIPSFLLSFEADTIWDFDAAASLMLHAAKSKATSSAKSKLKDSAKDGAEAAGAADGMTEVIEVYKLVKLFAKLFGALDPTFVMDIAIQPFDDTAFIGNACITKSQNSPGPAVVQILGPPSTDVTSATVEAFYVAAAGSSNKYEPGFVDLSVHSLCDYVCAAWNSTLDELNETSQSDCEDAQSSGSTQQANYNEIAAQNLCLTQASASNGIPWVTIESDGPTYRRYDPSVSCSTTTLAAYDAQVGICGGCAPVEASEASEPLGSWSDSCDEVSYSGGVLTANCATNINPNYTSRSSLGCSTGHWSNNDGELACEEPSGSWSTSCDFVSFSGTTLCASCATDTDTNRISESCQPCTSDVWSNIDGFLSCAPPPATQTASRSATPPAASKVLTPSPHGTPPDPPGVAPNVSLASNPNFETLILGADR
jgi:hypothetical protein